METGARLAACVSLLVVGMVTAGQHAAAADSHVDRSSTAADPAAAGGADGPELATPAIDEGDVPAVTTDDGGAGFDSAPVERFHGRGLFDLFRRLEIRVNLFPQILPAEGIPPVLGTFPVGTFPVGTVPVGSYPVGTFPGGLPVGTFPGSFPVGTFPVGGGVPIGSFPGGFPVGTYPGGFPVGTAGALPVGSFPGMFPVGVFPGGFPGFPVSDFPVR